MKNTKNTKKNNYGNRNNTSVKIVAGLLAFLMVLSLFIGIFGRTRASAISTIDSLKQKKAKLANEKAAAQKKIKETENEQKSVLQKKAALDEEMRITQEEIINVTNLITEYTNYIATCEVKIAETEKKEQEQWALYKKRVRAMEEEGELSYLEVLFTSTTLSELLSQIDTIAEIMEHDRKVYNDLVAMREELIRVKEERTMAIAGLEDSEQELKDRKAELNAQIKKASALIQQYEDSINKLESDIREIEEADAWVDKQIENAEKGGSEVVGEGKYLWPCPTSNYVTSRFGYRDSPTAGASNNHRGIDIGRVSIGDRIVASRSGTVRVSENNASYGNYVVINHGDGTTTTYAHMSKRAVSVGDVVRQGETIGYIGSTGISTGPHLHFEVTVNGTRVDPLQYFSGYSVSPNA